MYERKLVSRNKTPQAERAKKACHTSGTPPGWIQFSSLYLCPSALFVFLYCLYPSLQSMTTPVPMYFLGVKNSLLGKQDMLCEFQMPLLGRQDQFLFRIYHLYNLHEQPSEMSEYPVLRSISNHIKPYLEKIFYFILLKYLNMQF